MKKTGILCILLLILSCNKQESLECQIDTFLRGQHDLYNFNGNVLIAEKGNIIYKKSFGFVDFESKEMLNDSSIFNLASVNKQFTAMGILILFENGRLKLTDSLRYFFPELPYYGINIHQMLTHTSGLPDYLRNMLPKEDYSKVIFNSDLIGYLASEKPMEYFSPGEKFDYSNTGYVLLGSIIEKVSGKSYGDFLAENIFKPLGMNHTYVYSIIGSSDEKVLNYAYGFTFSGSLNRYVLSESLPEYRWLCFVDGTTGNKGVSTTTGDLFKWDRALRENLLCDTETVRKMNSPYSLFDTINNVSYGYGVMVGKDDFGSFIKHGGSCPGVRTYLINYTDPDRTFIVLSNNNSASMEIENSLANIVYGRQVLMPYHHKEVIIDSESLDNFTGTFKINGITNKFIRENTHLIKYSSGSGTGMEFLPESETKIFSSAGLDMQFEIEETADGKIRFFQIVYGRKRELEKEDLY